MATVLVLVFLFSVAFFGAERPILIAHRGVSAYLTEHTLESVTLAYGQGAVFVEQDLYVAHVRLQSSQCIACLVNGSRHNGFQ